MHFGDNSSPTFWRALVSLSEPNNINLDSSLKCTVCHFCWDHKTCSVAKARRHFLFLELISGFTTGALVKRFYSTKRPETVFLDKGSSSWILISRETAAAVLNLSFLINCIIARSPLLLVILGLPGDCFASHDPISLLNMNNTFRIVLHYLQ